MAELFIAKMDAGGLLLALITLHYPTVGRKGARSPMSPWEMQRVYLV